MLYVRKAFDRLAKLGVNTVVLGSGPARRIPDGFSRTEAFQQLVEFCKRIGPEARSKSITVAVEAQRKEECNLINNLSEAGTDQVGKRSQDSVNGGLLSSG